mmetsp:Transcript_21155/g.47681  ORF Transcript_21155/g.47681 Transcript_21155/m.47681 type:complete len:665 (+) Transcript_21155:58-2052(+)
MSGNFRDTFSKDDKKEPPLVYDDSAFMFFALTCMCIVAIPSTYFYVKALLFGVEEGAPRKSKDGHPLKVCTSATAQKHNITSRKRQRQFGLETVIKGLLLVGLWLLIAYTWESVREGAINVKGFDPFDILDVATDADDGQIKKAYRRMSKKYHPDLNPNDPQAEATFIRIAKAYAALTDDVAKANYEKYGNPDGPVQMKLAIGLPSFLMSDEHQIYIIIVFYTMLLFVIPVLAISYYQHHKQFASNGLYMETLRYLGSNINDKSPTFGMQKGPELLACSAESRYLTDLHPGEEQEIARLEKEVTQHKRMDPRIEQAFPIARQNHRVLLAHLQRVPIKSAVLERERDVLLTNSVRITTSMVEIASMHEWFACAVSFLDFRRSLVQALDMKSSPLMQVPHFTPEIAQQVPEKEIEAFLKSDAAIDKKRPGLSKMSDDQLMDIRAFADHASLVDMQVKADTEGESEIAETDVVTITVTLTRKNLKEGEAMGPVHAPHFAQPKFEEWWVYLTDRRDQVAMYFEKITSLERVVEAKLRLQMGRGQVGKMMFRVHAICDSYVGFDKYVDVDFMVLSEEKAGRQTVIHKEDQELDMHPTLFQSFLGLGPEEDSSDDEADPKPKTLGKKAAESSSDDSDDSSDDDSEESDDDDDDEEEEEEEESKGKKKSKK